MEIDPKDKKPRSHGLLWLAVCLFMLLAIAGMWSIDYFFSPEALAAHSIHDAAEN